MPFPQLSASRIKVGIKNIVNKNILDISYSRESSIQSFPIGDELENKIVTVLPLGLSNIWY